MSEQFQRVEPTKFDAPGEQVNRAAVDDSARPSWLLPALGGLGVLALAVIFVLPKLVDNSPTPASTTPSGSNASNVAATSSPRTSEPAESEAAAASPFADAVEARARAEAQELLAELIDVREGLEARGAEVWAGEEMAAIAEAALAGDERYRERDFEAAISQYSDALSAALALEQSLPERFEEQLAATDAAIESLDDATAREAFELAELLEPGAPELEERRSRLEALPSVMEAISDAAASESSGDLVSAVTTLENAETADPLHAYLRSERERVAEALRVQRFNAAMSDGYGALDESNFDRAQRRFEDAAKLEPGSSEAAAALAELAVARTTATLNRLQRNGEAKVDEEDWEGAISAFEEALAIDGSLRFAREGLALARPRAILDKELKAILEKPERLVDDAILREAEGTLRRARQASPAGETLQTQIDEVAATLEIARTPRTVRLRSDGLTEVTVYKVARLGLFEAQELTLRPGEYTAVGSRRGFRDVRVVFSVSPDSNEPVFIACSEPI